MRTKFVGRQRKSFGSKAFTLYEVLVAVAILALVAVLAVPQVQKASLKSKISMERANIALIQEAKEAYASANPGTPLASAKDLLPYLPDNQMPKSPFGTEYQNVTSLSLPTTSGSPEVPAPTQNNFVVLSKSDAAGSSSLDAASSGLVATSLTATGVDVTPTVPPIIVTEVTPTPTPKIVNNNPTVDLLVPPISYRNVPVTLTANASDIDNDPLNYRFSALGYQYPLQTANSMALLFPTLGTKPVSVLVSDPDGGFATASASVNVINRAPTVTLTNEPTATYRKNPVKFTATGVDLDNDPITYQFKVDSEDALAAGTNADLTRAFDTLGKHKVDVTVADEFGGVGTASSEVNITNRPPKVLLSKSALGRTTRGVNITFTASGSDEDSDPLEYRFKVGDEPWGAFSPQSSITRDFLNLGSFDVKVEARDGYDPSPEAVTGILVVNTLPQVSLSASSPTITRGQVVNFVARASDVDGDPLSYEFSKVDSGTSAVVSSGTNSVYSVAPTVLGPYEVSVKASDPFGESAPATTVVDVIRNLALYFNQTSTAANIYSINSAGASSTVLTALSRANSSALVAALAGLGSDSTQVQSTSYSWLPSTSYTTYSYWSSKSTWQVSLGYHTRKQGWPHNGNWVASMAQMHYYYNWYTYTTTAYQTLITTTDISKARGFVTLDVDTGEIVSTLPASQWDSVAKGSTLGTGSAKGVVADKFAAQGGYSTSSSSVAYNTYLSGSGTVYYGSSGAWEETRWSPITVSLGGKPDYLAGSESWRKDQKRPPVLAAMRKFDLDATGAKYWEWVGPTEGILVWNPEANANLQPTGKDLFGNCTWGKEWANGYEPLAALDKDGDGSLTGEEIKSVWIWVDKNTDAKVQDGELTPLSKQNIETLGVKPTVDALGGMSITNGASGPHASFESRDWWSMGGISSEEYSSFTKDVLETACVYEWSPVGPSEMTRTLMDKSVDMDKMPRMMTSEEVAKIEGGEFRFLPSFKQGEQGIFGISVPKGQDTTSGKVTGLYFIVQPIGSAAFGWEVEMNDQVLVTKLEISEDGNKLYGVSASIPKDGSQGKEYAWIATRKVGPTFPMLLGAFVGKAMGLAQR